MVGFLSLTGVNGTLLVFVERLHRFKGWLGKVKLKRSLQDHYPRTDDLIVNRYGCEDEICHRTRVLSGSEPD